MKLIERILGIVPGVDRLTARPFLIIGAVVVGLVVLAVML